MLYCYQTNSEHYVDIANHPLYSYTGHIILNLETNVYPDSGTGYPVTGLFGPRLAIFSPVFLH